MAILAVGSGLATHLAIPSLAAVLLLVAWRLIDVRELMRVLRCSPTADALTLLVTLAMTVLVDLTLAIAAGVGVAVIAFTVQIARASGILAPKQVADGHTINASSTSALGTDDLKLVRFSGPLFFGTAVQVQRAFDELTAMPKALVLDMRAVPLLDATVLTALETLAARAQGERCRIIVVVARSQPRTALHRAGLVGRDRLAVARSMEQARSRAMALLQLGR
jgi:sulfate permease, SulP family